jgi:hypothetical protein
VATHGGFTLVEKTQHVDLVLGSHRDGPRLEGG